MRVLVLYGINNRFFKKNFRKIKISNFAKEKNFEKFFFKVCCDYHSVFGLSFAVLDAYIRVRVRVRKQKMVKTDNFV